MIEPIKIEVGSKYILVLTPSKDVHPSRLAEMAQMARDRLTEWLKSDETFFVLALAPDVKAKFQKVDNEL